MTNEQKEYLRSKICIDTLEDLCASITKIGPYVFGVPVDTPVSANRFRYYLGVDTRRGSYRQFHIPKKSGGTRTINAPDGELKDILRTLSFILAELYVPTPEAMAFINGRSIVDNARQHLGQNYVLNMELSDFFYEYQCRYGRKGAGRNWSLTFSGTRYLYHLHLSSI